MQLKKTIAILVIFVCVGTALSAQNIGISFGGGALLDWNFGNGTKYKFTKDAADLSSTQYSPFSGGDRKVDDTDYNGLRNMSFGGFAFLDVTYAELDVSFAYGALTGVSRKNKDASKTVDADSILQLGFTLLGKYPVNLGSITVFPLLGVGYNIVLSHSKMVYPYNGPVFDKDGNPEYESDGKTLKSVEHKISEWNQFSILAGGGFDYNINKNVYIRFSALAQIRFASKLMRDSLDLDNKILKAMGTVYDLNLGSKTTTIGFGPVIKVAIGYRFR